MIITVTIFSTLIPYSSISSMQVIPYKHKKKLFQFHQFEPLSTKRGKNYYQGITLC